MTRKDFIKMCGLLGIGLPILNSCKAPNTKSPLKQDGKVLVIGAGAAGLTAAYLLHQKGFNVELLEASSNYGGRMKRIVEFADFPIPTGAEWLHAKRSTLDKIVDDKGVTIEIKTKPYDFDKDYAVVDGEKKNLKDLGFTIDQKFINSTWYDFFEQYVVPSIKSKIRFNSVVESIDYQTDQLLVRTKEESFTADKVILTVPVKLLQQNAIQFDPQLPSKKLKAINEVTVWGGCKAFIEFDEKFYPTVTGFEIKPETAGHKLYYDAAYGQDTMLHIVGLFAVGSVANPYLEREGDNRIDYILKELDEIFEGKATPNYKRHIFQNWSDEPFAQGAYVHYFADWGDIKALGKSVDDKLYFAGDAYTDGSDWSSVHAAANSAIQAVKELIG